MSLKNNIFRTFIPRPLTKERFFLYVEGLVSTTLVAESAVYPTEFWETGEVFYRGESIPVPIKSKIPGTWSCVLYDNSMGMVGKEIDLSKERLYEEIDFSKKRIRRKNIIIAPAFNLAPPFLGTGVLGLTLPNPLLTKILVGAFIKQISPVELNATDPSQPWKWNVTFVYSYIKSAV